MRRRLVFIAAFLVPAALSAGVGVWTTNGPDGQQGNVVADNSAPETLYSGTTTGMAASRDNGQAWNATGSGAPPLYVLAARGGIVYANSVDVANSPFLSSVLWKSPDAGATWLQLSTSINTGYGITIDPSSFATVYRSTAVGMFPRMVTGHFDRSTDGGQTWTSIDNGIAGNVVTAFVIDPHNPSILYLANVWEGIGVPPPPPSFFKSIDAGSTWAPLTPTLGAISGLAIDPTAGILYASASTGVYRSTDNGASFSQISSTVLHNLVLDAAHPNRLYGTLPEYQGVVTSTDGGFTWTSLNNGLSGSSLGVNSLAIDSTGRFLHITTAQSGVFDYEAVSDPGTLSLNSAHPFAVMLSAIDPHTGAAAPGVATQVNDLWGYFSIPTITNNANNPEVFVKLLDGTAINGDYWFFYGGLTNLEYTLTVTDVGTGVQKTYTKPAGSECGGSDTEAFAP